MIDERDSRLRSVFVRLADAAPPPPDLEIAARSLRPTGSRRPAARVVAAALALCTAAGLIAVANPPTGRKPSGDDQPTSSDVAVTQPPTATDTPVPETVAVELTEPIVDPVVAGSAAPPAVQLGYTELRRELNEAMNLAYRAVDAQTAPCMAAAGFEYLPTELYAAPTRIVHPWNWPNADEASSRGYQSPSRDPINVGDGWGYGGIELPSDPTLRAAYEKAHDGNLFGTFNNPRTPNDRPGKSMEGPIYDGCYTQAVIDIVRLGVPSIPYDGFAFDLTLQTVRNQALEGVKAAPDFVAAQQQWSVCMRDRGFDVSTIADAPQRDWPAPRPGPEEVATAEADWSCKVTSGIVELGDRLFVEFTDRGLAADNGLVDELRAYIDAVTSRASAVLGSG